MILNLGRVIFTTELWFSKDSNGGDQWNNCIIAYGTDLVTGSSWKIYGGTNIWGYIWSGSTAYHVTSTTSTDNNLWHHVAMTRDGTTMRLYINGVQEDTVDVTGVTMNSDGSASLYIGEDGWGAPYKGYQDEIRVSNTCRYPNGTTFTPDTTEFSSDANTMLLVHSNTTMGSTTFIDSSSSAHSFTQPGTGTVMHVAPKIGVGMGAFDGTGDYLVLSNSPDWDLGSSWTIEMWACPTKDGTVHEKILSTRNGNGWEIGTDNADHFMFEGFGNNATSGVKASTTTYSKNNWYHLAVTNDGTNTKLYFNGTLENTYANAFPWDSDNDLWIGGGETYSEWFPGFLDELRISKTVRYTSNFTPSTTAFKDDKDTILLMHLDGGRNIVDGVATAPGQGTYFFDDSVDAIFYDSATGVPTNKSIINFDGTGDYLTTPGSSDWAFTGEFTIELWANGSDMGADDILLCYGGGGGNGLNSWQFWNMGGSSALIFYGSVDGANWITVSQTKAFDVGQWYHIAVTRVSCCNYLDR